MSESIPDRFKRCQPAQGAARQVLYLVAMGAARQHFELYAAKQAPFITPDPNQLDHRLPAGPHIISGEN